MPAALDHTLDAESEARRASAGRGKVPHLWVLLEADRPLSLSSRHVLGPGGTATIGRGTRRAVTRGGDYRAPSLELKVPDPRMSTRHAGLEGALGRWTISDLGSRNGVRVNGKPALRQVLAPGDLVELGHTTLLYDEVAPDDERDDADAADAAPGARGLVTLDPELDAAFARLSRIAPTDVPVLILGETGTGKEVVARAVHELSARRGKFVGINSAAIPGSLLESELFGSARGAYSGSVGDRPGLVRAADGGTLFLDEIGDLPLPSQAALLRVLEERKVRPVGSTEAHAVDIRVVTATNKDVERLVAEGTFRDDLVGRIAGFRLTLPPLRRRRKDLGILVGTLLARIAGSRAETVRFGMDAVRVLLAYDFPRNIRELEHWLATAVALSEDGLILAEHLPAEPNPKEAPSPESPARPLSAEEEKHREEVAGLLRQHQGNVSAVARAAGKGRNQIHRWLKRYALDPEDFR